MPPRVIPSSAGDAGAVALDGSAVIPSRPVVLPAVRALESVEAAPLCVVPARPFAMFEGVDELRRPARCNCCRARSSETGRPMRSRRDTSTPTVSRRRRCHSSRSPKSLRKLRTAASRSSCRGLTSAGTPGDASVVEQVEAKVGSSADPTPASEPANEPVAVATAVARIPESVALTLVWLASASAEGPDVVASGTDPSGADGCDADPFTGTVADVPGPSRRWTPSWACSGRSCSSSSP
jgi:hypothetical protein